MTDAQQREAVRHFFYRWNGKGREDEDALYGEYMGELNIKTGEMIQGDLPDRALRMVREWMKEYQGDLQIMWDTQIIRRLPPLA